MSVTELPVSPYLFSQPGSQAAPFTFTVPATLEVQVDSATATFDGTGAGGSFLPVMSFYSPSGVLIARMPLQSAALAAGTTEEVSWFPFAPVVSGMSPSGGGIQFDTKPQAGAFLFVETDGPPPAVGQPTMELFDSGTGVFVHEDTGSGIVLAGSGASSFIVGGGGVQIAAATGGVTIVTDGGATLTVDSDGTLNLNGGTNTALTAGNTSAGSVTISAAGGGVTISPATDATVNVGTGQQLVVKDADGETIFAAKDGTGVIVTLQDSDDFIVQSPAGAQYLNMSETGEVQFNLGSTRSFGVRTSGAATIISCDDDGFSEHHVLDGASFFVSDESFNAAIQVDSPGPNLGFYGAAPVAQQTGVAVNAAAIHAALVNLGLITA